MCTKSSNKPVLFKCTFEKGTEVDNQMAMGRHQYPGHTSGTVQTTQKSAIAYIHLLYFCCSDLTSQPEASW